MKLTYKILAVAVAISLCMVMALPALAITITGYTDINIADYVSGKDYEGDQVIVSYNMPLRPYSEYYGTAADGTQGIFATSTDIYFSQEAESNFVTTFTKLIDFGEVTVATDTWSSETYSSIDPSLYTHAMVDGVVYELTWVKDSLYYTANFGSYRLRIWKSTPGREWFAFYASAGTYDLSIGTYSEVTEQIYEYSKFGASLYPLGFSDGSAGVVDVSDIREGANFDLTFSYDCTIVIDGTASNPAPMFRAFWLDEDYQIVYMSEGGLTVDLENDQNTQFEHTLTFTVPEGAAYFYLRFDTSIMDVKSCRKIDWSFYDLVMTCALSALEEESEALAEISAKLDELMNGNPNDQQDANDFKDNAGGQADKLDGLNDKMQNLQKPQLGAGDISVNDYVNPSQMLTTMPFLTVLFENEMPLTMIMLVLTVGLCAYALFGKRG